MYINQDYKESWKLFFSAAIAATANNDGHFKDIVSDAAKLADYAYQEYLNRSHQFTDHPLPRE